MALEGDTDHFNDGPEILLSQESIIEKDEYNICFCLVMVKFVWFLSGLCKEIIQCDVWKQEPSEKKLINNSLWKTYSR